MINHDVIEIAGAGPAGLAAAITLAQNGQKVVVHEARSEVGYRFQQDFQGLENWSTTEDVLTTFHNIGIETNFITQPYTRGVVFDAWDKAYPMYNHTPLFYLIERGPGPNSLDSSMLKQAMSLGVDVQFNSRLEHVSGRAILAAGPRAPDAIAVGYHFETDMSDGFWVICNDHLAPQGYAYLLVMAGRGTVKTCMFSDFKHKKIYVKRTIEAFKRLVNLEMKNPQAHGGVGNFRIPRSAYHGQHPLVGEQAGFQDTLWGFGIRLAIMSGVLAARSIINNENYDVLWKRELKPQMKAAVINRALYKLLGNRGYRWFLQFMTKTPDIRRVLFKVYRLSFFKQWLLPWAKTQYTSRRKDDICKHTDCHCVWCRGCSTS